MSAQEPADLLLEAVRYILYRVQTDPNLHYVLADTEAWNKLVAAEAAATDRDEAELRVARRKDLRPPHDQRQADVVVLRRRVEDLQATVARLEGQL